MGRIGWTLMGARNIYIYIQYTYIVVYKIKREVFRGAPSPFKEDGGVLGRLCATTLMAFEPLKLL